MNTTLVQETADRKNFGPVLIDGHVYPADPAAEEFTHLLMDCFQRGRNAAAAKLRQGMSAASVKPAIYARGKGGKAKLKHA